MQMRWRYGPEVMMMARAIIRTQVEDNIYVYFLWRRIRSLSELWSLTASTNTPPLFETSDNTHGAPECKPFN